MNPVRSIALVLAFILQGLALWLLVTGRLEWLAFALHLAGAAAWGWGAAPWLPPQETRAWWLLATCALMFPIIGLLASFALLHQLRAAPPENNTLRYVIWSDRTQTEWSPTLPTGAAGMSIVEILQSPHTQLRRNAALALRDLDPQLAIPLLRKGLQDSDEQVRIYAQNILRAMLERFEASVKALEQKLAQEPDAVPFAVNLAEQYFELVYLDVAGDDETAAHYLGKAIALLEQAAIRAPNDGRIACLGLKYALRARDVAAARRWLEHVERCQVEPQQVLPWSMELAFMERNWSQVNAQLAAFTEAGYINQPIEEISAFWRTSVPLRA